MSLYKAQKAPRDTQLVDQFDALQENVRRLEASASALRLRIDTQTCSLEAVEARVKDVETRVSAVEARAAAVEVQVAEWARDVLTAEGAVAHVQRVRDEVRELKGRVAELSEAPERVALVEARMEASVHRMNNRIETWGNSLRR